MSGLSTTPTSCIFSRRSADSAKAWARSRSCASKRMTTSLGSSDAAQQVLLGEPGFGALGRVSVVADLPGREVPDLVPDEHVGSMSHDVGLPGRLTVRVQTADHRLALERRGIAVDHLVHLRPALQRLHAAEPAP